MANFYDSDSAIERATGMSVDAWLDYLGYGERPATIRTLTNLTTDERVERERVERAANLDRLEQLASAGMPLFVDGEVNANAIEDAADWREFEDADEYAERISEDIA